MIVLGIIPDLVSVKKQVPEPEQVDYSDGENFSRFNCFRLAGCLLVFR